MNKALHDGFVHHLQYELDMLLSTYGLLQAPQPRPVANALIESFCIHARQLIDFFESPKPRADDLIAREFTGGTYDVVHLPHHKSAVRIKLNKQIAHLTKSRTTDPRKKIGPADRKELLLAIAAEYQNFCSKLSGEYQALLQQSASVVAVDVGGRPAATNEIASTTNTFTEIMATTSAPHIVQKTETALSPKAGD